MMNRMSKKVNAMNTTWKAHDDGRFTNLKREDIAKKLGAMPFTT